MKDREVFDIALDALNEAELNSSEIPAIDLYVDQILNLIADKLDEGSQRYKNRQLTKTMINNYSKAGLITPVSGKKYNKEQILQMLTVYTLKGTLSIGEIKRLLSGIYATDGFDGDALCSFYDRHIGIKEVNREQATAALDGIVEGNGLDLGDDVDYASAVCALVALSSQLKNIAQAMIDERFPEPEESEETEEGEKFERKVEKKVEKAERKVERMSEKAEKKQEKRERKAGKKAKDGEENDRGGDSLESNHEAQEE